MATRSLRSKSKAAKRAHDGSTSTSGQPEQKRSKTITKQCATSKMQPQGQDGSNGNDQDLDSNKLQITEDTGDIFEAPPNSLLIHACNCEGHWGAGIAKAFKQRYPKAYEIYADRCEQDGHDLFRKALLIPPVDFTSNEDEKKGSPRHLVGCLFTSRSMGRKKDSPARILAATKPAMVDLMHQVKRWNADAGDDGGRERVGEVRMCKINSGLFAVPWEETKAALEAIDVSDFDVKMIKVLSPSS